MVNQKEHLNSALKNSIFKVPNSFITAQGSIPVQLKTKSIKCKADNQGELHGIKKLKTLHNSNNNTSKQKNEQKICWTKEKTEIHNI